MAQTTSTPLQSPRLLPTQSPPSRKSLPLPLSPSQYLLPRIGNLSETAPSSLQNTRIIQSTLVYLINLPESLTNEQLLRSYPYFGQYGTITKCMVSKSPMQNQPASFAVYLTYSKEQEAAVCIKACNNYSLHGHTLHATYGTTKYCAFFISGKSCPKPNCLFLHEFAVDQNTVSREGLPVKKHIQPKNAVIDSLQIKVFHSSGTVLPMAQVLRGRVYSEQIESRFAFTEESNEEPLVVPEYCGELSNLASPSKSSCQVRRMDMAGLLGPSSLDKWASDLMEIKQRSFSECGTADEDEFLVVARRFYK